MRFILAHVAGADPGHWHTGVMMLASLLLVLMPTVCHNVIELVL